MYESNSVHTTASVYGYDQPKSTADVSRVPHEMGMIQKLIAEHGELASQLEQRLHAVLRPCGPETAGSADKEPRQVSSPMSCDLEGFRLQLGRMLNHYGDILNRLEV